MNVRHTTFSNGLRVITCAMPHVESVSLGIWVGVGGRYEPEELSGASHFIEHLAFKGTRTRSAKDISQAIEGRGGQLNAFTQEECTCYYARVAQDAAWNALDVMADMFLHPRFAAADIAKERAVIVEEIMMCRDEPEYLVEEMLERSLWKDHPLGRSLTGTPETLRNLTRERILDFRNTRQTPLNTLVVMAGKVEHDACVAKAERHFGSVRGQGKPAFERVTARVPQQHVSIAGRETEQAHAEIGIRLFGRSDARRHALKLLNIMLGENMSSRLFQVLREKHGLAYSIHSSAHLHAETGCLVVSAGIDREKILRAVSLIVREMARLKERPAGAGELRRAKDYAIGQLRLGLESTTNQMMWAGDSFLCYDRFVSPEETMQAIRDVTAEDIRTLACRVLRPSSASLSLIAPRLPGRGEEAIRDCILSLGE